MNGYKVTVNIKSMDKTNDVLEVTVEFICTELTSCRNYFSVAAECMKQFLWPPCVADAVIIFCSCSFYLSSSSFFPHLFSAVRDWMSNIFPHMMWP